MTKTQAGRRRDDTTMVRVPRGSHALLKGLAERDRRTLSDQVFIILGEEMKRRDEGILPPPIDPSDFDDDGTVMVRFANDAHAVLKDMAARNGRTLGDELRFILEAEASRGGMETVTG